MTREEFKEALRIVASDNFDDIPDNPPEHVFSVRHQRRMRRLFKSVEKYGRPPMHVLPKVAMIAVVTIAAFALSVTQIKAIREPFLEFVTNIYDKFVTVDYTGNGPTYIVNEYQITFIPDDFTLIDKQATQKTLYYKYENVLGNTITFTQSASTTEKTNFDKEQGTLTTLNISDTDVLLYKSDNAYIAHWSQDGYHMKLTLIGDFSKDTIIKMIGSVKPIE